MGIILKMRSTAMLMAISAMLVFALSSLPSSEASGRSVTRALLSDNDGDVVDDDATVRWYGDDGKYIYKGTSPAALLRVLGTTAAP